MTSCLCGKDSGRERRMMPGQRMIGSHLAAKIGHLVSLRPGQMSWPGLVICGLAEVSDGIRTHDIQDHS
jgi:hypothetical protein